MDFIEGLPNSEGYNLILVMVDWLSKYAHLIGLSHFYTATKIAQLFITNVFKLYGMPSLIVTDRDPTFQVLSG